MSCSSAVECWRGREGGKEGEGRGGGREERGERERELRMTKIGNNCILPKVHEHTYLLLYVHILFKCML